MLLAVDLHEDFIDVKGVAIAAMFSPESAGVHGTKLDAPEANCFSADSNASLRQEIFNISVAQVESEVKPDSIADDIRWESVTFVSIHPPILAILAT